MTIYQEIKALGVEITNHESDLQFPVTPETEAIVEAHFPKQFLVCRFRNQITQEPWFEIPFMYDPFWDKKSPPKELVSDCCKAVPRVEVDDIEWNDEDNGICSKCGIHCQYVVVIENA